MSAIDIIIVAIVVVAVILAGRRAVETFSGERDCCSGERREGARVRRVRVADKDASHYPFEVELSISGMSCQGCARTVEGALDGVDGTWAEVDLASSTAHVRSKTPIDLDAYRQAVSDAGYKVVAAAEM
jgi:copper chaperone CopZ